MRSPGLIVGGIQVGGSQDEMPSALLAISFQEKEEARRAGTLLSSIQNGTRPLKSGPPVFVGDTRIKVSIQKPKDKEQVLWQVSAKIEPNHLTHGLVIARWIPLEQSRVFLDLYESQKHYVMTVAVQDKVLFEFLHLIKYVVERRGI